VYTGILISLLIIILTRVFKLDEPVPEEELRADEERRRRLLAEKKRAEEDQRVLEDARVVLVREAVRVVELPNLAMYSGAPYLADGVVVIKRAAGKAATFDDLTWKLSPNLCQTSETGTVVCLEWGAEHVGTYSDGAGAYRHVCVMKIFDVKKQMQIVERRFIGSDPPRTRAASDIVVPGYGAGPDSEIEAFLTRLPSATGLRPPSFG
jgi:hypothetical protein